MKRRILTVALMMAVLLCLSGCSQQREPSTAELQPELGIGGPAENGEPAQEPTPSERVEPAEETAPEEAQEARETDEVPEAEATAEQALWAADYAAIVEDWTKVEDYAQGALDYEKSYFGYEPNLYGFDHYFLTDVDTNGTPELMLVSQTMGLTAVLTYSNDHPVFLCTWAPYGINTETAELIIHGHWHGAGGSYENEWSGIRIRGETVDWTSFYIDYFDWSEEWGGRYAFLDEETGEWLDYAITEPNQEYEARYQDAFDRHVANCRLIESFQLYELGELSGLGQIQ